MNINKYIKEKCPLDMSYLIESAYRAGYVFATFKPQIDQWTERFPEKEISVDDDSIELQTDCREQTLAFINIFGGTFKKSLEDYQKDKIRYDQTLPDVFSREGDYHKFTLSIRSATPPPSCEIVEYEEEVPATTVKKRKIVCPVEEQVILQTVTEQEIAAEKGVI